MTTLPLEFGHRSRVECHDNGVIRGEVHVNCLRMGVHRPEKSSLCSKNHLCILFGVVLAAKKEG